VIVLTVNSSNLDHLEIKWHWCQVYIIGPWILFIHKNEKFDYYLFQLVIKSKIEMTFKIFFSGLIQIDLNYFWNMWIELFANGMAFERIYWKCIEYLMNWIVHLFIFVHWILFVMFIKTLCHCTFDIENVYWYLYDHKTLCHCTFVIENVYWYLKLFQILCIWLKLCFMFDTWLYIYLCQIYV